LQKQRLSADQVAEIGERLVSELAEQFLKKNKGRFIAISLEGKIIAVADTMRELNDRLAKLGKHETSYIKRVGFDYIAELP
jgi:hypothetical protein